MCRTRSELLLTHPSLLLFLVNLLSLLRDGVSLTVDDLVCVCFQTCSQTVCKIITDHTYECLQEQDTILGLHTDTHALFKHVNGSHSIFLPCFFLLNISLKSFHITTCKSAALKKLFSVKKHSACIW